MRRALTKRLAGRPRGDEGALLLLALIFILLMAIVVTAILTEATTTFSSATVTRQYVTKSYAADAGLRYGVQQVRANTEACQGAASAITPPSDFLTSDGNSAAANQPLPNVSVNCTLDSGQATLGANGFAIITHEATSAGFATSNHTLSVGGPVFMAAPPSSVDVDITKGNAYTLGTPGSCPARPGGLVLDPGYAWTCQTTIPDTPVPALPTNAFEAGMPLRSGPVATPSANCRVFAPGIYRNVTISLASQNYFASGVYYLDNAILGPSGAVVFAGAPHSGATYLGNNFTETSKLTADDASHTPCSGDAVAKTATGNDGTVNGTGVKFILGGNSSSVFVDNPGGYMEIYSRWVPEGAGAAAQATAEGAQGISVMTVPASGTSPWNPMSTNFTRVCLGQGNGAGGGGGGSNMGLAVHGRVYAPNCQIHLRDNSDVTQLIGGLDVGRLDCSTSANVGDFLISVESDSVPQAMTLTSTATLSDGGRAVTGTAHIQVSNVTQAATVTAWRLD
jgi:Tfp pilus assembly protein PilX